MHALQKDHHRGRRAGREKPQLDPEQATILSWITCQQLTAKLTLGCEPCQALAPGLCRPATGWPQCPSAAAWALCTRAHAQHCTTLPAVRKRDLRAAEPDSVWLHQLHLWQPRRPLGKVLLELAVRLHAIALRHAAPLRPSAGAQSCKV